MTAQCGTRVGKGWRHTAAVLLTALLASLFAGCASVLPQLDLPPSTARVAPADSPLAAIARDAGVPSGLSGVRPLQQAAFALDARLALIERAQVSLDLQYYLVADDPTGRTVLRALRDAALRGVRVRLLLDDVNTEGMDLLLSGLAATPNVELRLFNPFTWGRDSSLLRVLALASDFKRLNHRMHNKLFIADGAVAVVGGRNLADEYFLRGAQANFIDFDLLVTGAVVPTLNESFDKYWNSHEVYPVQDIARLPDTPASLRTLFDELTQDEAASTTARALSPIDVYGWPAFSAELAQRHFHLIAAVSTAYADSPEKADPASHSTEVADTVTGRFFKILGDAHTDVVLFSPYFVPGKAALERLREIRAEGVRVRVITNSLAVSDEPLVNIGFGRHRTELLEMGVELYEVSSSRLKRDNTLRGLLGNSIGRLHAKLGFIDLETVLVGSMNLDPRSARINTEIGVRVVSPELANMVLESFKVNGFTGVYQVRLKPHGMGVYWTTVDAEAKEEQEIDSEPETGPWQRMQLLLMSLFVPDSEL